MQALTIQIEGMSCGHCVANVERALARLPGVRVKSVKVGSARIEHESAKTTEAQVIAALAELGYAARIEVALR